MNKKNLKWILLGGGVLSNIIAVLCLLAPFISVVTYGISGFELAKLGFNAIETNSDNFIHIIFALWPVFVTILSLIGSIGSTVIAYLRESGKLKSKPQKEMSTAWFVINCILCIIPLIINLFIVQLTGFGQLQFASIGAGAVINGLFLALGSVATFLSETKLANPSTNESQQQTPQNEQ